MSHRRRWCSIGAASVVLGASVAVAQPATPLPSPAATAVLAPSVIPAKTSGEIKNKVYSYGDFSYSLLFSARQIDAMQQVLRNFEDHPELMATAPVKVEAVAPAQPIMPSEPSSYPSFHLNSIVYRHANDWAVWLDGKKITPAKNPTNTKIVSVSAHEATFVWEPEFKAALALRHQNNQFASTALLKHHLARVNTARYDAATGAVYFVLRPNQTFASGYMAIFEGNVEPPAMDAVTALSPTVDASAAAGAVNTLFPEKPWEPPGPTGVVERAVNTMMASQPTKTPQALVDEKTQPRTPQPSEPVMLPVLPDAPNNRP